MQVPTLHFHFDPTFILSLSFQAIQGGASGCKAWLISNFGFKPKIIK
jgi:hypothetical protein